MHGDSFVILMIVFGMFMVMRRRGFGPWAHMHSRMEQEIAELRAEQRNLPAQGGPTLDQVQLLEDRVRVLERIVTDQNYGLARDIEGGLEICPSGTVDVAGDQLRDVVPAVHHDEHRRIRGRETATNIEVTGILGPSRGNAPVDPAESVARREAVDVAEVPAVTGLGRIVAAR